MSILGLFNKHGKIERYEKKSEPMGKVIPFRSKRGLEELQLIDISRSVKKSARSANR